MPNVVAERRVRAVGVEGQPREIAARVVPICVRAIIGQFVVGPDFPFDAIRVAIEVIRVRQVVHCGVGDARARIGGGELAVVIVTIRGDVLVVRVHTAIATVEKLVIWPFALYVQP